MRTRNDRQPSPLFRWIALGLSCVLSGLLPGCSTFSGDGGSGIGIASEGVQEAIDSFVDYALEALAEVSAEVQGDGQVPHGVVVLPFTTGGKPSPLGEHLARQVETAMAEVLWVRDVDDLVLVSRRHIDDLLREQKLTMSDTFAQGPAEVLGRLRGADLLITGELADAGDSTELTLQILNVPDGRVLRGRVLDLPMSLPRMEATLDSDREEPVATAQLPLDPSRGPALLQAVTDRGLALLDSSGTPTTDIGVILTVGNPLTESDSDDPEDLASRLGEANRPDLDLCILLDTSASMRKDDRIAYARFAANQIVDSLRDGDRFCLITFANESSVVMKMGDSSDEAKRSAHQIIDRLRPSGKTNFESALREVHHMPGHRSDEAMTHYVVLISDGKPTIGMEDAELLGSMARDVAARGASVHTVGVSQGIRFDVLNEIANQGGGRMHVLDDPSSLASFLPYLVNSVANAQADQALLEFRPAAGLEVEIKSSAWRMDPDGVLRANLGLVGRDESVVRLLHLEANGVMALAAGQEIRVGEARLSYEAPDGRAVIETADVRIGTTTDPGRYQASARLETLLESHLIGLRDDLMDAHDLLVENQPGLAVNELNEVREHVALVLSDQQDPLGILSPLRRLAERAGEYAKVLMTRPQDPTVRSMLYREACGRPESFGSIDD